MKLYFYCKSFNGREVAFCSSDVEYQGGERPICSLLTDDGGLDSSHAINWLNEGVRRVRSVIDSENKSAEWWRECWAAEIDKAEVKIFSIYDEDYFEILQTDTFEQVLRHWLEFIQKGFLEGEVVSFEIKSANSDLN